MTRDELKAQITPIMLNQELTDMGRHEQLIPIMLKLLDEDGHGMDTFDRFNSVMAEIVDENGLARH